MAPLTLIGSGLAAITLARASIGTGAAIAGLT